MSEKQFIQPKDLFDSGPFGFTHVVTSPPGRLVFVSGQVAVDTGANPVGGDDLAAQVEAALGNLDRALRAAGALPRDVTMVRVYVVGYRPADGRTIGEALARFFGGGPPPASTWIGVQALAVPGLRVEIEAFAVVEGI